MLTSSATRPYDSQSRSVPASHFYSGLTGRSYQTEFGAWKQSFLQKITTGSGIASTLGTSLGMNRAMRGVSPVLMNGVARLGIRAPLPAMLVSTTA
ncbi:MAG: hypothetical protein HYW02_08540, partial [Deltaproteobacteria bacterium]|nr:hypothetical protein [Deltaproteobacteria bacterium]